ncbi:DsrE family protein [Mobilitalea sibirica]|uniref:DsrE family protein n=2 Tax=Mobilitalea sibirica TaxID=1462919 RepID=A0A8J7H597_9FIRM|nr:DsrE family protein [Mobilitalea sibirica]
MAQKLYILWTTDNQITAEKMVLMYSQNCMLKHWWDEVTIIIWGASAQLANDNPMIQEKIKMAIHTGVKFIACKGCSDQLNVSDKLSELGVEVVYWGHGLTEIIQNGEKLITI